MRRDAVVNSGLDLLRWSPMSPRRPGPILWADDPTGVLPAHHSKHYPVERCWGILEQHWNGALLDSVEAVTRFTESMTWKGRHPVVEVVTTAYATGVRLTKTAMAEVETHLRRLPGLEKWFVDISPTPIPRE